MEGLNVGRFLLLYFAVLVFGITSVAAVGLLVGRLTKAARIVFAAGFLCADTIAALAALSFLAPEFNHDGISSSFIVLTALSLLLGGSGQFAAALQTPKAFAASFGCAACSIPFLAGPLLTGDAGAQIPGLHMLVAFLGQIGWAIVSLLFASAAVAIAVLNWPRTHGQTSVVG